MQRVALAFGRTEEFPLNNFSLYISRKKKDIKNKMMHFKKVKKSEILLFPNNNISLFLPF